MLLAIDAGNTNIVFAVYEGEALRRVWRCKTDSGRTADEYAAWLCQLFAREGLECAQVGDAVLSSVVPDANFHLIRLCRDLFRCDPLVVSHKTVDLKIGLEKPSETGADRLVNAVAAIAFYRTPAVVVDFGTATTFDVIDADGTYRGGVIAPGVNLSMAALHQAAAKLPRIGIARTERVIGNDTVSAMQSGIYWGYLAMIEGLLSRIAGEMGEKPFVIATGGLAALFGSTADSIDKVDPDLTLRGLLRIYQTRRGDRPASLTSSPTRKAASDGT